MTKRMILALTLGLGLAGGALAAEPIEGKWKTASGETAVIGPCGSGFCITLKTGKFAGKKIGELAGSGGEYTGSITDPVDDKTYDGAGSVSGNALKMKGCVLKVFCKSQSWTRL
ncbi:uncharacterized protein SAMN05892877_106291 [Rhizobium subbaraonis]|uniref:DUF2147 domain-containing protein n=1 Tax=Rhizobium subbaraonis TaxID=908946 RepID=A0A285UDY7_9HYPH|nr:DUF2147 domain-containing protein [Rhizobium subbaraonis]SOC39973.1 uncharacterized protein SAMN05892877_106291 [Rhizobium subbaraonis]